MAETVMFLAQLPTIDSAVSLSGYPGEGARVRLDLPEDEMPAIVRLPLFKGKLIRVTIEVVEPEPDKQSQNRVKRSRWVDNGTS